MTKTRPSSTPRSIPARDSNAAVHVGRDMAQAAILVLGSAADVVDVVTVDVDDES